MKRRYLAMVLPAAALGIFLFAGCEKTNEENLKGESQVAPPKPGTEGLKTYADATKYMEEQQAAQNKAAGKGKAAPRK